MSEENCVSIEITKEIPFFGEGDSLTNRLRKILLRGFPNVKIYEKSEFEPISLTRKQVLENLQIPQPNIYKDKLNRMGILYKLFMEHGINIFNLEKAYDFISTSKSGEKKQWTMIPPIVEQFRMPKNYNGTFNYGYLMGKELKNTIQNKGYSINPEIHEIHYSKKDDLFNEINDGSHRIHYAIENGFNIKVIIVKKITFGFPYYAIPIEYSNVKVMEKRNEFAKETKIHIIDPPGHKELYRLFPSGNIMTGEVRSDPKLKTEQDETIEKSSEFKDALKEESIQDFYISSSRKKPKIYIAGTLTHTRFPDKTKKFYERIAEVATQKGFEAYLPHKHTDPIEHAHISAREVYEKDYEMISDSDIMICFVGEPSLGVGTELEIAKNNNVKIILIYPKEQKISREALGNPAISEKIIYSSEEEALDKLGPILYIIKKKLNFNIIKESELGSRPTWNEYFMKVAITLSSRSSCVKVHSGSVIVHNKSIVGEGYNGAPPGIKTCLEKGACTKELKTGQKYEDTLNTGQCIGVHSEMNALAHTNTTIHRGATIYTTILPCHVCAKTLISHGIKRVVFKRMYDKEEAKRVIELFKEAKIQVDELDLSPKRLIDIDFSYRKLKFDIWSEKEKEKIKEILNKDGQKSSKEIELEKTFLLKKLPEALRDSEFKEIIDIYYPKYYDHPVIRLRKNGDKFELTKKEPISDDSSEQIEQTLFLTPEEFNEFSKLDGKKVHKKRYYYNYNGRIAEIDVFQGDLKGLIVVDFEFNSVEEKNNFEIPDFCLVDVTQQEFIAGGKICGKSYEDIKENLERFEYSPIYFE